MIKFLGEYGNESQAGNKTRQLAIQKLTGWNEADVMSNIYDLAGNNFEWTAQARSNNARVVRGGTYINVAADNCFYPPNERGYNTPTRTNRGGCSRSVLYLK